MKYVGTYSDPKDIVTKDKLEAVASRVSTNEDNIAMAEIDIDGLQATVGTLQTNVNNVQTALTSKQDTVVGGASTITADNLTTNRALVSNSSGKVAVSTVTSTELGYLDGVTSNVQTQLNKKLEKAPVTSVNSKTGAVQLNASDVGAVSKTGDTMTGKLTVPQVETGDGNSNFFQCRKFRGEGDANTYYHAIDFGYKSHDRVDFHEYGGIWNFFKNTSGKANEGSLCGKITTNGWEGGAKLTGSPTAPTPGTSDNSTRIATTAFVNSFNSTKLESNGDGSNVTAAFTAASSRTNIATGEKLSVLFGKIAKWLSDLGSLAFKSTVAKTDLASDVQTSLGKADSALQSVTKSDVGLGNVDNVKQYSATNPPPYPVTSVNSKTGAVTLGKSDVGLGSVDNVKQYSASNPPPYPVKSVNSKTGTVTLTASDIGAATTGDIHTALNRTNAVNVANSNYTTYMARGEALFSSETTPTINGCIAWVYG